MILSVEVGGLLGVTQQLSSFQAEFNTQPHRNLEGDYNPFASPEKNKCPNSNNNSLHDDSNHRVAEEHWEGSPNQLQQDQNGLSQNSVDILANSLQSNLSVVSCNQVRHRATTLSVHVNEGWITLNLLWTKLKSQHLPLIDYPEWWCAQSTY